MVVVRNVVLRGTILERVLMVLHRTNRDPKVLDLHVKLLNLDVHITNPRLGLELFLPSIGEAMLGL